jgi:hypothetical protein
VRDIYYKQTLLMDCCTVCKIFTQKEGSQVCCMRCQRSRGAYHDATCKRLPCRENPVRNHSATSVGCSTCNQRRNRADDKIVPKSSSRIYTKR